jgi:uncharacterized protein
MPDESCEFPKQNATPDEIRDILRSPAAVAIVGLSDRPERDSHGVARYLIEAGWDVIPVNPAHPEILGRASYPSLDAIPGDRKVEIVDIFRRPEAVPEIVEAAIRIGARVVWMQEGIVHNQAADAARARGLKVVMGRCMMKELAKLRHAG